MKISAKKSNMQAKYGDFVWRNFDNQFVEIDHGKASRAANTKTDNGSVLSLLYFDGILLRAID